MRLLSVDPGSTKVGVSIFEDGELLHCARLHHRSEKATFTDRLNEQLEKLYLEFLSLIRVWEVTHVCWEIVPAIGNMSHKDFVVSVSAALKCLAFHYRLPWQGIAAVAAKKAIVGDHKATKIQVREKVLELYPDIKSQFGVTTGQYDAFDSVIIGLACQKKGVWAVPDPEDAEWL
jgi:Holliday junction resolvasome RuvABC endonuclease subunit